MKHLQELELCGISKAYPNVQANEDIHLHIKSGEIVALLGENGAGKSTLMNILSGLTLPDSGQIKINGKAVRIRNPKDAMEYGIGMVHQHFMLIQPMSVAENIALGLSITPFFFHLRKVHRLIREYTRQYGFDISSKAKIWQLSVGQQQKVEILKVLMQGADLIILDEPTSVLTPQESDDLFKVLKKMKEEGHAILFITHKLNEIKAISDRVVVLRKGRVAIEGPVKHLSNETLAQWMMGRDIDLSLPERTHFSDETLLEVSDLSVRNIHGMNALSDLSFSIKRHEVLGIAGVSGNGQKELAEALAGIVTIQKGNIKLKGEDITHLKPKQLLNKGLAHIPEERLTFGVVPTMMIYENTALKDYDRPALSSKRWLDISKMKRFASKILHAFEVAAPSIKTTTRSLSGGNIQKLILGREMMRNPELIIAVHPTYGLDISATQAIRKTLIEKREQGSGILLISEDLEELMMMSDRIAVLYQGKLMGVVSRKEADPEKIGLWMAGISSEGSLI